MPEFTGEPLNAERVDQLRKWLKKPEGRLLREVIGAKKRLKFEESIGEIVNGKAGATMAAGNYTAEAMRYDMALKVLDEMESGELFTLKYK